MSKDERFSIILKVYNDKIYPDISLDALIDLFILDELRYVSYSARINNLNIDEECNKVLAAYAIKGHEPSCSIKNYIKYCSANPIIASMQHQFNDFVSYIGVHYDGSPVKNNLLK